MKKHTVETYTWKRENIWTKEGKILTKKFKKSYIGLTESQVRAKLEKDKEEYNIWAIDVYRSTNNWCKVIYINFGGMAIRFDKHTRRAVEVC